MRARQSACCEIVKTAGDPGMSYSTVQRIISQSHTVHCALFMNACTLEPGHACKLAPVKFAVANLQACPGSNVHTVFNTAC